MASMITAVHVLSPMPRGEAGGADEHVVDLALAQQTGGRIRPIVVSLGAKGYTERITELGVLAATAERPYGANAARALHAVAVRHGAAVIHSHGYDADYVSALARIRYRVARPAYVATVHGLIARPLGNFVKTGLDLACFGVFDGVIVTAQVDLTRHWPIVRARRFFVPNGVAVPVRPAPRDRLRHELGVGAATALVGFCGRLSPEKRPDLFVRAAAELARVHANARFVVIGSGDETERLQTLAGILGASERIIFLGYRPDAASLIGALDVLVCPSDSEGTPRVVLEAMAQSVAVLATDVGGLRDLIVDGSTGLLVPRRALGTLVARASALLDRPAWRWQLGAAAAEAVREQFSRESMARGVEATYEAVLSGRNRRT
jgi:L-malate glycosyltransferase